MPEQTKEAEDTLLVSYSGESEAGEGDGDSDDSGSGSGSDDEDGQEAKEEVELDDVKASKRSLDPTKSTEKAPSASSSFAVGPMGQGKQATTKQMRKFPCCCLKAKVAAPPVSKDRRKSVSAERYDPEQDADDDYVKVVNPKSDEQRKRLGDSIKNILLFRSLDHEQMQEVLDAMFEKQVKTGDNIIKQGDDGDNFYVIDNGKYDIYVDVNGKPKLVGNYTNEGFFGELALMYNMPRAATITASTKGSVWALDRQTFRRIVLKTAFIKRKKYEKLIESVPIFKQLDMYERMNVCDALTSKTFKNGEKIINQGDKADNMYFVEKGAVKVCMTNHGKKNDPGSDEQEISRIETGGYFGELALVTRKPRAASVYADGDVECAVLDVNAFERLMGPCMNIMKRNIEQYESQLVQVFGNKANVSDLR